MQTIFPAISYPARRWGGVLVMLLLLSTGAVAMYRSAARPDNWVLDKTVNHVDCYYLLTECGGKKVVLLKFNNKNTYKVKVTWKEVFDTQLQKGVAGFRGKKQLLIAPGETFASGCADSKNKELLVLPADVIPTYAAEIVAFEFNDIQVTAER